MTGLPTHAELVAMVTDLQQRVAILEGARDPRPVDEQRRGPYQKHSATSRAAALHNAPKSGTQRQRVLAYLVDRGDHGATRQEIAAALNMSDDSVRPRVVELIEGGWALASQTTRRTRLGEEAEVLVATLRARQEHDLKVEQARQSVSPDPVNEPAPGLFDTPATHRSRSHYDEEAA